MPPDPTDRTLSRLLSTVEEIGAASGGYAIESNGAIYIPVVMMRDEGKGHCSAFLDALPRDRTLKFPNVINPKLRDMLVRRDFKPVMEWAQEFGEEVEVYVRSPLEVLAVQR